MQCSVGALTVFRMSLFPVPYPDTSAVDEDVKLAFARNDRIGNLGTALLSGYIALKTGADISLITLFPSASERT